MRLTEFLIVIIASLMFLIPKMKKDRPQYEIQAQEEAPSLPRTYKITYQVETPKDESIADIIWLKKAAAVAQQQGMPYFNIKDQNIKKSFNKKHRTNLSVVEGHIELESDSLKSEYDAQEIEELTLHKDH